MPFRDFINSYNFDPNAFDFEKFKADAVAEYDNDNTVWSAKVGQLTEQQAKIAAENQAVKAKNWDLLQQIPAEQPKEVTGEEKAADEAPAPSIESFFGKE